MIDRNVKRMGKTAALGAATLAAILTVTGCASNTLEGINTDLIEADDGFPALTRYWYDGGQFVDPNHVLRIAEGQSKDQVRQLLGNPHFSEGFAGVREWNYVFNFYTGEGNAYLTCQYQVIYDQEMRVENTRWRDPQCPALLVPVEVAEEVPHVVTISGDVLFDFDSDRLGLEGRRTLDRVAHALREQHAAPALTVLGYTDRFGGASYNLQLSQSRAETVRDYLVQQGLPRERIRAIGRGQADPVVECHGERTPAVKECLRPNRRVEIVVTDGR